MKKIFGLFAALILLAGCDDGEMTFQSFNFGSNPQACGTAENQYISINENEVLILNMSSSPLLNIESEKAADGTPIARQISLPNGAIQYRIYDGNPSATNVCSVIDNPDISVREYWSGSGTISVATTRAVSTDGTISFSHSITLDDVSFSKSGETIRIEDNYLGEIRSNLTFKFNFNTLNTNQGATVVQCAANANRKYAINGRETLILDFESGAFDPDVDEKTITLSTSNTLSLRTFSGTNITGTALCSGDYTTAPAITGYWVAQAGTVRIVKDLTGYNIYLNNDVTFFNTIGTTEQFVPTSILAEGTNEYLLGHIVF